MLQKQWLNDGLAGADPKILKMVNAKTIFFQKMSFLFCAYL
jgi:hypothetical protein